MPTQASYVFSVLLFSCSFSNQLRSYRESPLRSIYTTTDYRTASLGICTPRHFRDAINGGVEFFFFLSCFPFPPLLNLLDISVPWRQGVREKDGSKRELT